MSLKIVCSGHLVRFPLGGHSWHHLQYLVGFQRMGHEVTFFEDQGGWRVARTGEGRDKKFPLAAKRATADAQTATADALGKLTLK